MNELYLLGKTLDKTQQAGKGSMWIQLVQGSAAASVVTYGATTDNTKKGVIFGGMILLTPLALSKILTNKQATMELRTAIEVGAKSPKFHRVMSRIAAMNAASYMEVEKMQNAISKWEFYSNPDKHFVPEPDRENLYPEDDSD
jgi:hypothetical protein